MPKKKNIKSTAITSPKYRPNGSVSGGILGPDEILAKEINRVIENNKKTILSDPKKNPFGNAKLVFDVTSKVPMLGFSNKRITTVDANYAPQRQGQSSPSRSQLLKARGTQSSTTRKLIK